MLRGMQVLTKGCNAILASMAEKLRLSKLLSQRGICSRRDADRHIAEGNVSVNGRLVTTLGTKVDRNACVSLETTERPLTVVLNKPVGYVSTQPESGQRSALELILLDNQFGAKKRVSIPRFKMLSVAGRLDIDSKGLLVFTQDGVVARRLIGPQTTVEKEYLVRVEGTVDEERLRRLAFGLSLDGKPLKRAQVTRCAPNLLKVILKEGKKRQIRRMCEQVSLRVVELKRVRIGPIKLASLPQGKWRLLSRAESEALL